VKEIFTLNHIGISGKAAKKWQQNGNKLPFLDTNAAFSKNHYLRPKSARKLHEWCRVLNTTLL